MSKDFVIPYSKKYGKVTVHNHEDAKGILMISCGEANQAFLRKQDDSLKSILLWPCDDGESSGSLKSTYSCSASPFAEHDENTPVWLKTLSANLGAECAYFQI